MVPGLSSPHSRDRYHDAPPDTESQLATLAQEGGVGLINYLLANAVADDQPLSNTSSPREWTFCDILHMLSELQKEWKNACAEELESLRKRQVFELTELPLGHKAIRNRWVFDVKTAFLYGKLDEEIYMEQPEGFKIKGQEHKVLRLCRAIYGLKQAALAWW